VSEISSGFAQSPEADCTSVMTHGDLVWYQYCLILMSVVLDPSLSNVMQSHLVPIACSIWYPMQLSLKPVS